MPNIKEMIEEMRERGILKSKYSLDDVMEKGLQLEAQLELIKPLPIGELLHRLEGQTYRKWYDDDELNKWRERAEKAESELSVANEKHGWIKCSDQTPDANQQRRVCVFTPNDAADLRYRLVPASLFKAVCSSATHWYYVNDPVEGNADAE